MVPELSVRALRHLRHLNRRQGTSFSDEQIHDIGTRLLSLSAVAAKVRTSTTSSFLTDAEAAALTALRRGGVDLSARGLSIALGYRSSRSGHLILQRLLAKGVLVKARGKLVLASETERWVKGNSEFPI